MDHLTRFNELIYVISFLSNSRSQKEQGHHHRLAVSAGRPGAKSRTADRILFEKENDFCTTFQSAVGRPTLRWQTKFSHVLLKTSYSRGIITINDMSKSFTICNSKNILSFNT